MMERQGASAMANYRDKARQSSAGSLLVAALLCIGAASPALAEQPSVDQIIKALRPAGASPTRSLSTTQPATASAPSTDERHFIDTLRNRPSRSLTVAERDQITAITQDKPAIDLEITFDYNSTKISSSAMPVASTLGQALSSPDLKGSTFFVEGYTDAKGATSYNQDLSERRADAIKRFIVEKYGVTATDLVTVGYGKTRLKNESDPFAAENRRVRVINAMRE
jgi:outer membrane protein OmpA-like peptidoglycan-associated protein